MGSRFAVDGLIYGTLAMAILALAFVRRMDTGLRFVQAEKA
jgi:hypothetical protein